MESGLKWHGMETGTHGDIETLIVDGGDSE